MRVNGEQWPNCVQVQMLINDKVANDGDRGTSFMVSNTRP